MKLDNKDVKQLFALAKTTIENGIVQKTAALPYTELKEQQPFNNKAATFVTLQRQQQLRGCIGTLEAHRSLYEDVAHNAYAAAFKDPRFNPVSFEEVEELSLEISILSQPQLITECGSKADLIEQLNPFEDGLIISDGARRATFLPSVWQQVEDKQLFVQYLMQKAGILNWCDTIQCSRYFVESYENDWGKI
ncbi:MAG: AmmeMemoRadiSam system protein A [Thiomicrorhabdus sp.]|nr:AmmeMemoRadiSam system protein A [Thiomicrorhabdus sp.]